MYSQSHDELKILFATSATVPAVKIKAADSPQFLIAKVIPEKFLAWR